METINQILESDVYSEEFITAFTKMLDKFCVEYDDMSQMSVIKKALELQKAINQ